jgi:hypothetical protein
MEKNKVLFYSSLLPLLITPLFFMGNSKFVNDEDVSYRHQVKTQEMLFHYINNNDSLFLGKTIAADFPIDFGFSDFRAGYIENPNAYRVVPVTDSASKQNDMDFYILSDPGNFNDKNNLIKNAILLKEFKSGYARAVLYKK